MTSIMVLIFSFLIMVVVMLLRKRIGAKVLVTVLLQDCFYLSSCNHGRYPCEHQIQREEQAESTEVDTNFDPAWPVVAPA